MSNLSTFIKKEIPIPKELNEKQAKAYKDMVLGYNIFLSGPGGTGKSFLIDFYYKKVCSMYGSDTIFKTSTTGISAKLINGTTLHSFAGIGLGLDDVDTLLK